MLMNRRHGTLAVVLICIPFGQVCALLIGSPVSLSGPFVTNGMVMRNATMLFTSIAAASGVSIEVVALDDHNTPAGVHAATATQLESGVDILLGPYFVDLTAAERNLTETAGKPVLLVAPAAEKHRNISRQCRTVWAGATSHITTDAPAASVVRFWRSHRVSCRRTFWRTAGSVLYQHHRARDEPRRPSDHCFFRQQYVSTVGHRCYAETRYC